MMAPDRLVLVLQVMLLFLFWYHIMLTGLIEKYGVEKAELANNILNKLQFSVILI